MLRSFRISFHFISFVRLRFFTQRAPLPDLPLRPQEHRAGPFTHNRERSEGLPDESWRRALNRTDAPCLCVPSVVISFAHRQEDLERAAELS